MGFCFSCFPLILVHSSEIFGRGKLRPSLWAVGNSDLEINFSVAGLVSASERVDKKKRICHQVNSEISRGQKEGKIRHCFGLGNSYQGNSC